MSTSRIRIVYKLSLGLKYHKSTLGFLTRGSKEVTYKVRVELRQHRRRQERVDRLGDQVGGDDDVGGDERLGALQRRDQVREGAELGLDNLARIDRSLLEKN